MLNASDVGSFRGKFLLKTQKPVFGRNKAKRKSIMQCGKWGNAEEFKRTSGSEKSAGNQLN